MADMLLRTESTRSAVYRAAWALARADREATLIASAAKAYAVESAGVITRDSVQIHGGNGFTWEYDLHCFLKRALTLDQHYGATAAVADPNIRRFVVTNSVPPFRLPPALAAERVELVDASPLFADAIRAEAG
jgi:alkylation response protein AidB-like acyl-CoA dehydrogenase